MPVDNSAGFFDGYGGNCYNRANAAPLESGNSTLEEGGDTVEIIILLGVTAVGGTIGTVIGGQLNC